MVLRVKLFVEDVSRINWEGIMETIVSKFLFELFVKVKFIGRFLQQYFELSEELTHFSFSRPNQQTERIPNTIPPT